jgi:hypothetical protein
MAKLVTTRWTSFRSFIVHQPNITHPCSLPGAIRSDGRQQQCSGARLPKLEAEVHAAIGNGETILRWTAARSLLHWKPAGFVKGLEALRERGNRTVA